MSELKHTKGEWRYSKEYEEITTSPVGLIESSKIICRNFNNIFKEKEEREANARLIACAPEMLEALIRIISRGCQMSVNSWRVLYKNEISILEKATNQKIEDLL